MAAKSKLGMLLGLVLIVAICVISAQLIAAEQGEKPSAAKPSNEITIKQLPKAVRSTLEYEVKKGKINGIEKDMVGKDIVYSADITRDGIAYDVEIDKDGKLISISREVAGETEADETAAVKGKETGEENEAAEAGEATTAKEGAETDITFDKLPKAVQVTLKKEVGKGTIDGIEMGTVDGKTVYSADVTKADGKKYDVEIYADGKLKGSEIEKPGEEASETPAATEAPEAGEKE